jgi:hypothetical protein
MNRLISAFALTLAAGTAVAADPVHAIKIQPDKAPDNSSLKSIVQSITKDAKTNDEKAISIYNWMAVTHYHLDYPAEKEKIGVLKEVNVYGWSLCGGLHTVQGALYRELGWGWRYVGWSNPGHTTIEAEYDGKWHYLDSFLEFYAWMPDPKAPGGRTIAGEQDIKANPSIVTDGFVLDKARNVYFAKDNQYQLIDGKANWTAPAFLDCGDPLAGVVSGTKSSNSAGSPAGWGSIVFDSDYSTNVDLNSGYGLTLTWAPTKDAWFWLNHKKAPVHSCGDKEYRNNPISGPLNEPYRAAGAARSYSNGELTFSPDLSSDKVLNSLAASDNVKWEAGALVPAAGDKPASITVALQSPYVTSRATGEGEVDSAELSIDAGKTWKKIQLADFSADAAGSYSSLVKLTFSKPLKSLKLVATVCCNRGALPYLSPGKNKVTVSVADAKDLGENKLVVTYAYNLGSRTRAFETMVASGHEIAKGHSASWDDKPTVVQKTFSASDLPATFDIDVPTAKDRQPVYPRMIFVRREVVAPGAKPLPLPEGALEPKMGPNDELKELPNPYTIGYPAAMTAAMK